MVINVYDKDIGSKDDYLGKCKISTNVIRTAMTSGQLQDVWKLLEDVKRGSIHLEIGWCDLKLSPSMPTKDEGGPAMRPGTSNGTGTGHHQAVITIVIDSCQNLANANEGNKMKLPNPKVQCEVCEVTQITDPVIGTTNPVFAHRMNFLVNDPDLDTIFFSVIDEKGKKGDNVILGKTRVHISDLLVRTSLTMVKTKFPLEHKKLRQLQPIEGKRCPMIIVSMALRYIHRPKTSGYGAHKSLQDLHKIMQTKSSVASSAVWRDLGEESASKTVEIKNAINKTMNSINILDDQVRNRGKQGSQLIKDGVYKTGDAIYEAGVHGSHAVKSSYGVVKDKGSHAAHKISANLQKADLYVKDGAYKTGEFVYEKGVHGVHAVRTSVEAVKDKGAHGAHVLGENINKADIFIKDGAYKTGEYIYEKGADGAHAVQSGLDAIKGKGIRGAHAMSDNIHKVDTYVKDGVYRAGEFIHDQKTYGSHAVKSGYETIKDKGAHGGHALKESVHHANVYAKNKSWEGAQRTKDTCHEIYEKSAAATEAVKETAHKANEYVYQKGVDGKNVIKDGYHKVHDKGAQGAHATKEQLHKMEGFVHDTSHTIYQKSVDGVHGVKDNVHKMDDFVRNTSSQGSHAIKENITKVDGAMRRTGAKGSKIVMDSFGKVQDGVHKANYVYNRSSYLETDFNQSENGKKTEYTNGETNGESDILGQAMVKPNFITSQDDKSVVRTNAGDPTLVAPLAQEESLTLTNGFHSLASAENGDTLFKIKPEEATQYVKENSVRSSNVIDVLKNPPEPPKPKIQLSLKYNLTNMTLSVVVHKIRNLQETNVTWLPSAKVVTRVIEMNGLSRFRRVVNTKRKTKTQRHNVSPVFEETLEYFLPVGDVKRRRLEVSVYHDSRFPGRFIGRNVVLGRCLVSSVSYILRKIIGT